MPDRDRRQAFPSPRCGHALDRRACYRNGVIEETGLAAGVLNHPANGIAWLVRKLSALIPRSSPPRSCSLRSFIRPLEAGKGDTIQADYGAYGMVSCHFA